tara:strand:+ start:1529 stop:1681 length:153 start_codon:yes stop_codon:yes gene_type:complete
MKSFFMYLNDKIFAINKDIMMSEAFVNSNLSEYVLKKLIIKFGKKPVEKK